MDEETCRRSHHDGAFEPDPHGRTVEHVEDFGQTATDQPPHERLLTPPFAECRQVIELAKKLGKAPASSAAHEPGIPRCLIFSEARAMGREWRPSAKNRFPRSYPNFVADTNGTVESVNHSGLHRGGASPEIGAGLVHERAAVLATGDDARLESTGPDGDLARRDLSEQPEAEFPQTGPRQGREAGAARSRAAHPSGDACEIAVDRAILSPAVRGFRHRARQRDGGGPGPRCRSRKDVRHAADS